jgi:ABC-type uncharacterized transport system permease subunit
MILLSAYCAVLLSFASGLLALMMNQRQNLLAISQYSFNKFFGKNVQCRDRVNKNFEEQRYPTVLKQAVFILLGLSGVFAIMAGLAVLISKGVITDQIALGLPWLPPCVRIVVASNFKKK